MGMFEVSLIVLAVLFTALASGLWVALALTLTALAALLTRPALPDAQILATSFWSASTSWDLTALPMFIWMGEILFRSKLSEDLFAGLSPLMRRLPGRLVHVNVVGCAIFAAISGSSAATTQTIGKISLPELKQRGYDDRIAIGSLAGAGTLGLLIPPSIILIVYGAAVEQSIARLFIAGVVPGIVLALLFMGYVALVATLKPSLMPPEADVIAPESAFRSFRRILPTILLIAGVIGSIYGGIASPTEAAVIGVVLALVITAAQGMLTRANFIESLMAATRVSAMIAFILAGAAVVTTAMGFTGLPRELAAYISSLELSPLALLAALTLFFMVLGCFLDGISMVVLTTSVVMPLVTEAGFDLIWFGIYLVIVVEMAQITPPVGFNLFVIQGLTGQNIFRIAVATAPFFGLLALMVVLLALFPDLALFLPRTMFSGG
ncbi:TRAP transporter large permease [Aurantimonas endophytica]|uniref:TRAP transporter large permease protein n=1 Tax=Aurantimonas endophytica TaxID=1522175 RepID=A0A7W6MRV7_9HYPH|nr:TRAP transporter large permease subunit [Aurantimonas endophytica]MBB4005490.1 tripartite ATP-independent transporter DctM subunit [Aurantimonas endophytica]MCO6405855.1 TRAP transporter large permease subunit [Aurantimonas endophytica]